MIEVEGKFDVPAGFDLPASRPADGSAAAVVLANLQQHIGRLQAHDPLARADAPDAVHQMRVATRRLRSALATFRPVVDRRVTDPLREELQWLGEVLGGARDAEVIRDHLTAMVQAEPDDLVLGPVQQRITIEMGSRHRAAHDHVVAELDGQRYRDLLDTLDRLLAEPPFVEAAAGDADDVLLPLVARTWKRVKRLHRAAAAEPDPARRDPLLHEIRKAAKRARYAGEALVPTHGAPAKTWAEAMEAIQETLGAHQDTVVIRQTIREIAVAAHLAGENGFTYGRLHALEQARAEATALDYEPEYDRASRTKLHRWLHR
ncbi:MAG: CHAD domain-containing protein [Candidatus Nanopelagicales bacterium]